MIAQKTTRHNWTKEEIQDIYNLPLMSLVFEAASVHRQWHAPEQVELCTLLSIKTGGCPEDCSYCPQAARYHTDVDIQSLLPTETVLKHAENAKAAGATRFCMGAAWRQVRDNRDFERVVDMVKGINEMDMEVCCMLGMLTENQAIRLKEAGLHAYNHNLDTSEQYYDQIISTRKFDDRIDTINNVRKAGITVCSGGIIGLGESIEDRVSMLATLANMEKHPESVPVNALVRVKGTPLENNSRINIWEMVRMIATARIIMPASKVRLSAGRAEMSETEQAWCFMAGANSIFTGEDSKLLTTPNPTIQGDLNMLTNLGLKPRKKVH